MYTTQRDIFISQLQKIAERDKDVIMISVDMGAPSLDSWREKLPTQFFAGGISEQNSINFAAGLAAEGKKVFVYLMSCWAARCFEQLRYSCDMAKNPITFVGNGVGLGYAPAGPAHCPTEDIGYIRTLNGIEIISPANLNFIYPLVSHIYNRPALRLLRLERTTAPEVEPYYRTFPVQDIARGYVPLYVNEQKVKPSICLLSSGFMLGRALVAAEALPTCTEVFDVFTIKPLSKEIAHTIKAFDVVVTLEEQTLAGGFGSAILEIMSDARVQKPVLRLGLPSRYIFENGNRNHLLNENGLSVGNIIHQIKEFVS